MDPVVFFTPVSFEPMRIGSYRFKQKFPWFIVLKVMIWYSHSTLISWTWPENTWAWSWSWQLVSLISDTDGGGVDTHTHTKHRTAKGLSWKKEKVLLLSVLLSSLPSCHLTMHIMAKERARRSSVRMIHCQFAGLFIKLRSVQQPGRWYQPPHSSCNLH